MAGARDAVRLSHGDIDALIRKNPDRLEDHPIALRACVKAAMPAWIGQLSHRADRLLNEANEELASLSGTGISETERLRRENDRLRALLAEKEGER